MQPRDDVDILRRPPGRRLAGRAPARPLAAAPVRPAPVEGWPRPPASSGRISFPLREVQPDAEHQQDHADLGKFRGNVAVRAPLGVYGPITTPATRYPTSVGSPNRTATKPPTNAATRAASRVATSSVWTIVLRWRAGSGGAHTGSLRARGHGNALTGRNSVTPFPALPSADTDGRTVNDSTRVGIQVPNRCLIDSWRRAACPASQQ